MREKTSKRVVTSIIVLSILSIFAIGAFALYNYSQSVDKFYKNVKINGVDVGGLNINEASGVIEAEFVANREDLSVQFEYENKIWKYTYKDFEMVDDFSPMVRVAQDEISSNNFFERYIKRKQLKESDGNVFISYRNFLGGFDKKIDLICDDIYQELREPEVIFTPNEKNNFSYKDGQDEILVDREKLENIIDEEFKISKNIRVKIPTIINKPEESVEQLKNKTKLRSSFSTSYANSNSDRKHNIKTALNSFNGLVVYPDEEVSFNATTGMRTKENGYKSANIILNGVYVEGTGGGVCQASTTLYNAILLANLEITEVNKHSMPASYVPLGQDAMVSEGISDLKFKNTSGEPIYIKTKCDNTSANVQVFGLGFENGDYYKTRSEFVKSLPHLGDRIVKDVDGKYSDKVTFKGEYLRLKYPSEGYEANLYLQHYTNDDKLIDEMLIRHETYLPQEGIIIEGTEDVYDGVELPKNDVKFIPPQTSSNTKSDNISNKLSGAYGEKYNP